MLKNCIETVILPQKGPRQRCFTGNFDKVFRTISQ